VKTSYLTTLFLVHRFLSPWWWRPKVPPKRRFLQEPHDVTSQKTAFFILLAVFKSTVDPAFTISCVFAHSPLLQTLSPCSKFIVLAVCPRWSPVNVCCSFRDGLTSGGRDWKQTARYFASAEWITAHARIYVHIHTLKAIAMDSILAAFRCVKNNSHKRFLLLPLWPPPFPR
jgi:hypothetical protein